MKVLVIGSGGRESALVWKIAQSKQVTEIYCAPGNPGTAKFAKNVPLNADAIPELLEFSLSNHIDLTVVGPEIPLIHGIVDLFEQRGLHIIGPNRMAAQLEGSKVFCKNILQKYNIPTAAYATFTSAEKARAYVRKMGAPIVIKADGAAAGKGVVVALTDEDAMSALTLIMESRIFGEAGDRVVIEEMLVGQEASILAFCDGETIVPMTSCQDHKRIFEDDLGPNTGGMGVYSPVPYVTPDLLKSVMTDILEPTVKALREEGIVYRGILYAGLMLTEAGPKVIEYNVRFGDPETQVILPRLKTDIMDIFRAILQGRLAELEIEWSHGHTVGVVLSAGGYPGPYEKEMLISGLDHFDSRVEPLVFHAGTALKDGHVVTSGGRVLNVVASGNTLKDAIDKVYVDIPKISFEGMFYRRDIGTKGLV